MDLTFWLNGFPLPPTVNKSLMPIAGKVKFTSKGKPYRQGRMVKTKESKQYVQRCLQWALMNNEAVSRMKASLHDHRNAQNASGEKFALRVDCWFVFHVERLNHENAPDADNRLKPCLDALKMVLELDDVHYFASSSEKVSTTKKEQECTIIRITPMTPRTVDQIRAQMMNEAISSKS